jgi:hypothetical protein
VLFEKRKDFLTLTKDKGKKTGLNAENLKIPYCGGCAGRYKNLSGLLSWLPAL